MKCINQKVQSKSNELPGSVWVCSQWAFEESQGTHCSSSSTSISEFWCFYLLREIIICMYTCDMNNNVIRLSTNSGNQETFLSFTSPCVIFLSILATFLVPNMRKNNHTYNTFVLYLPCHVSYEFSSFISLVINFVTCCWKSCATSTIFNPINFRYNTCTFCTHTTKLSNLYPLLEVQQLLCIPVHVFVALNVRSVKGWKGQQSS